MHTVHRVTALAGALALSATMAGCAAPQTPVDLPAQDVAHWVLPLDRFIGEDDIASNYAEVLLEGPCMREAGYLWDVPLRDVYAGTHETASAAGLRIFNVSVASKYGYRNAPSSDPGAEAWKAWAYRGMSRAEADQIGVCIDEVRTSALKPLPSNTQLGNSLRSESYDAADNDGAVGDAERAWHECMKDVGIPDLPETPTEFPSPWLRDKLDIGDPTASPSAEEIRYATVDAECRQDSGYIDALYQALWNKEAQLVRDNADALLRNEVIVVEYREKVAQIISENAPPAPE